MSWKLHNDMIMIMMILMMMIKKQAELFPEFSLERELTPLSRGSDRAGVDWNVI